MKYSVDTEDFYQNAPCGFLTCDGEGRIVGINNTLLTWTGRERGEIEGLATFSSLLTAGSRIFAETHIIPLMKMQGYVNEISLELRVKDDSALPALVNAYRAENTEKGEEYYRLTVIDYTARKKFEQELIEARKAAEKSERLLSAVNQDLERFAYIASHDLQAPLNTISGLIHVIKMKQLLVKSEKSEKILELIIRNAERMKMMIHDLLEYRKYDAGSLINESVSLKSVCAEAVENLSADIRSTQAKVKISDDLPEVRGAHIRLVRLFQNLFTNAIKFRSKEPPVIQVRAEIAGDMVRVSVADNGRGFDPSKAEIIFGFMERLQSRDEIEGTGLGLAACRRITDMHGGRIWAESKPGEGSVFFVELPLRLTT